MVVIHGLPHEFAGIVLGSYDANQTLALVIGFAGIAGVIALNVAVTVYSLRHKRQVQRVLGRLVRPLELTLLRASHRSTQRYKAHEVSAFYRVNGYPPDHESYRALVRDGFRDYRLRVGGLVDDPTEINLDQLRALGFVRQVTKHNCIQGWSATAAWGGVPLGALLDHVSPTAEARYVVFHALDDKSHTDPQSRPGYYYGTLPLNVARRPQTILALEMNGHPLPVEHGAPVRLRMETQLGFKMVKWIGAIELVADYADIGQGQGGWREDTQHYETIAAI